MSKAEFREHLAKHGVKSRPEGISVTPLPVPMREALRDLHNGMSMAVNQNVKDALERDIRNRLLDHFRFSLGETGALFHKAVSHDRGVLRWDCERLLFGAERPDNFSIYVDLLTGETLIFPEVP